MGVQNGFLRKGCNLCDVVRVLRHAVHKAHQLFGSLRASAPFGNSF